MRGWGGVWINSAQAIDLKLITRGNCDQYIPQWLAYLAGSAGYIALGIGVCMDGKTIQLLAAILGLIGSVILAVSLNRVLFEVRFVIDALAVSIDTVVSKGDVYVFRGLDERIKTASRISNSWVRAGIYCVFASALLAAWSIYVA